MPGLFKMSDPIRRLKLLPWRSLLQTSILTIFIVFILELLLVWGYTQSSIIRNTVAMLYSPPLGILMPIAIAVGIGALAVYLCERSQPQVLNTSSLWALVLCLLLALGLKLLLPLPSLLIDSSEFTLIGIIVGVFWKGRPYWR
jgi:hypothetical protein